MKKLLIATTAIAALTIGSVSAQEAAKNEPSSPTVQDASKPNETNPALQENSDDNAAGGVVGGTTGAVAGAIVGGPIGAVIGGFAGAIIGAESAVPEPAVTYVVENPVPSVAYEQEVAEGAVIVDTVEVRPIPDYPEYGYVYVNGRPVLVRLTDRTVVYSPGYAVPQTTVTYVESNPVTPISGPSRLKVGDQIEADVELVTIPDDPSYAYVYTESGPVLVNTSNRTVVWIKG